jgi:hypothetical protein
MNSHNEKRMSQYLLGQLPEHEQAEIESQYMADDSFFEELLAIENDLRDAYARGELSKPDREAFEQRLLMAPHQKQKQEFAQALRQYLAESDRRAHLISTPVAKWRSLLRKVGMKSRLVLVPVVSVTVMLLIVGSWWLSKRGLQYSQSRKGPGVGTPTASPPKGHGAEAPTRGIPPTGGAEAGTIAIVLAGGSVRGVEGELPTLVIPADVSRVRVEARFEGNYPRYQVLLDTVEGSRVWSRRDLEAQAFPGGKRIFLDVSSNLLPPDDYFLTVRGLPATGNPKTLAEYTFRVVKR